MASRFWVGGTGTWDATTTTHWSATSGGASGASVPGSADTVTFDGSSGGGTVTPNYDMTVTSITMGTFTGTLDFSTSNNNPTMQTFSSISSGVRTLNMGSGTWNITGNAGIVWNLTAATNFTLNPNTSTTNFTYSGSTGTRQIGVIAVAPFYNVNITAGSDTIFIVGSLTVNNNFSTSGFTGIFSKGSNVINVGGNFTLGTGSSWSNTGSFITFNGSGTQTVTTNGVNMNEGITINSTGTVILGSDLDITGVISVNLTLTAGTFTANNFNVSLPVFLSANTNVRTLNMGSGTWNVTGNATNIWNMSVVTNLTFNSGTSILQFSYAGATGTRTFSNGTGPVYYNISIPSGSDTFNQTNSLTCNNFSSVGFTGTYSKASLGVNINGTVFTLGTGSIWSSTGSTIVFGTSSTATMTTNGVQVNQSVTMSGTGTLLLGSNLDMTGSVITTLTVTQGTFSASTFNITVPMFNSSNTNVRTINMGSGIWNITGNAASVFTISTVTNLTLNSQTSTLQFSYSGSTGTRTVTYGAGLIYNNIFVTAGSDTITLSNGACNGDFSTVGFTGVLATTNATFTCGGNWTMGTGSTISSTGGSIVLNSSSSVNITMNGVNMNKTFTMNGTGTFTLASSLDMTGSVLVTLNINLGTFTTNNFNISVPLFVSNVATTRTFNLGSSLITITGTGTVINFGSTTGLTVNPGTSTFKITDTSSSSKLLTGSVTALSNLWFTGGTGIFTLGGNATPLSFNNIQVDPAAIVQVFAGKTIVINSLTISGTVGNINTFQSTINGSPYFIQVDHQIVSLDYMSFQDTQQIGDAHIFAGIHSTNVSNNQNITFTAPTRYIGPFPTFFQAG